MQGYSFISVGWRAAGLRVGGGGSICNWILTACQPHRVTSGLLRTIGYQQLLLLLLLVVVVVVVVLLLLLLLSTAVFLFLSKLDACLVSEFYNCPATT